MTSSFTLPVPLIDVTVDALVDAPETPAAVLVFRPWRRGGHAARLSCLASRSGWRRGELPCCGSSSPMPRRAARRRDRAPKLVATLRAAVAAGGGRAFPDRPLVAGGKSMGGRMAAIAAGEPGGLPGTRGMVFAGFPLHAAGKPSTDRAKVLESCPLPMLFLQGDRDRLADPALLGPVIDRLGDRATRMEISEADHGFHVAEADRPDRRRRAGPPGGRHGGVDPRPS